MTRKLKALARDGLVVDGISHTDAATEVDRQRAHVVDMLDPDGRSMTGADLLFLAAASDTFWRAVCEARRVLREKRGERK